MFRKSPSGQVESAVSVPVRLPSSNGHAGDDARCSFAAHREQLVLRILIEHVIDDLDRVDESGIERPQHVGRLPPVDADADRPHQSLFFQFRSRPLPAVVVRPGVAPDVKLLEIDRRDADVREALLRVLADVVGRIDIVQRVLRTRRPPSILRRNLRRRIQPLSGCRFRSCPSSRSLCPSP